jgi:hypothetical protein
VVYDPGWDMPRINWQQQGSFETGEIPLAYEPDAGPLICLPPINQYWLPLILGCLDQLRNPSTWITSNDTQLNTALDRANRLMQMLGERAVCFTYQLRFTSSCVLQYSTDGGATWTDVDGWDTNFLNCVSSVIIPPIPPNPGPSPINQHACNIAGYIATEVLQLSITKAVNDFNAMEGQVQYAQDILLTVAYAFPLTALALDAFAVLYGEYTALTIGDFTAASTDPVLWSDVTCAIYEAIRTTGYIDASNMATVVSNICAISYSSSTVITAICSFVSALQLRDWQGFQNVGALDDVDCSACVNPPGWCYEWNASSGNVPAFDFTICYPPNIAGQYVSGTGFVPSPAVADNVLCMCHIGTGGTFKRIEVDYTTQVTQSTSLRSMNLFHPGGPAAISFNFNSGVGTFHDVWLMSSSGYPSGYFATNFCLELDQPSVSSPTQVISRIRCYGT